MPADARNRELAAIHVGKKALGLDDPTYRAMLWTVARVESARDLDYAGRRAVLEHMRQRGFERPVNRPEPHKTMSSDHGKKPQVPADRQALVDKLEAQLAAAARPWNYVRAMAKRMFHVDQLEWATAEQLRKIVAALEYDARRRARKVAG
jgi:phage gp16-like protein